MAEKQNFGEVMKDLQGYFKEGERRTLFECCESPRDALLIRLLWKSGRRVGEITQLKVSDINFEDRHIVWNIEKKKRETLRVKPLDNFTLALLKEYIIDNGLNPLDKIFPITRQRIFQIVREIGEKANVNYVGNKRIHPHHFRHSFAIDMIKASKDASGIRKVQQLLEHSSLNITEGYLQFGSEDLREMVEKETE